MEEKIQFLDKGAGFYTTVQAARRIAVPKIVYNSLDLEESGTVEVIIRPVSGEEGK